MSSTRSLGDHTGGAYTISILHLPLGSPIIGWSWYDQPMHDIGDIYGGCFQRIFWQLGEPKG